MSVRFVIGRAGSGKTLRCFQSIVEMLRDEPLGDPVLWLLPKQATFMAERQLACASGLEGFCRARVVSFESLGEMILNECGGIAVPEVTQLGRQMILGHVLRKHEKSLRFFNQVAHQPGLAVKLEGTLAEFDRCGKDPTALETLVQQVTKESGPETEADPFYAKLHDLQFIYKAYTDYVGQERLDPRRHMEQVLNCISTSRQLRAATVFADGFADFTDFERRVLARLGKACPHLEIMLLMDPASSVSRGGDEHVPHEMSLFHRVEQTYRRLLQAFHAEGVEVEQPVMLREVKRFRSPPLAEIERGMFEEEPQASEADGAVEFVEAPNRRVEVENAARWIRQLTRGGLRLRDIAVLVRSLDVYHDLINAAFREHDVRYFVDRRRTMAHHPLLQFVRAVLQIAQRNWSHDSVMLLLKCGLSGLAADEADRLENYVLEHRLRGSVWGRVEPWNWCRRMTKPAGDDPTAPEPDESREIEALRKRICEAMTPFLDAFVKPAQPTTVRQISTGVFQLLSRFQVRKTLAGWIDRARTSEQHEQAEEHQQAWAELVKLFEQMVDLLGDEPVTLSEFYEVLESGLETFDLALTPPTVDEVLVGQVDRTRTPDVKAVLVLGLNEGVFPHSPRDTSILSDAERQELEKRQFDMDPGTERRLLDENLLGYIAFTRGSERLYVSRSLADDSGRTLGPSPFWRRLRKMFPDAKPLVLPQDDRTDPSLIGTPRQLLTGLMRWARHGDDGATANVWPSLYQWLATYPVNDDSLDVLRHRAWKALGYENSAALSPIIAKDLFPQPLKATVSQIEAFAACPFKHFLRYGLGLEDREEDEVVAIDLENAFHKILEDLVRDMLRKKIDWSALSPEQSRQLVQRYAAEVATSLRGEMMLSNARNRYLLGRIERTLEQVIAHQQAAAQRGAFRTGFANVSFGREGPRDLPPLIVQISKGAEVHLQGRIDRVDVLADESAFAIFDYRLYGGELSLSKVYHGLTLQLLTYLLVVEAHGEKLAGKPLTPAAAFYLRLLRQLEKVDHPDDACEPDDPKFPLRTKPRGIFDGQYFPALDNDPDCTNSDVVNARLKKDGTFGYKNATDVADAEELKALLERVRGHVAQVGERIMSGVVDLEPYRMGTVTPCPRCSYKSVCRFDASLNHYHHIQNVRREEVLRRVVEEAADAIE
jgi:ATP-dependent helicase/nuclease subunit B